MKLISLNTWGGRAGKSDLLSFFEQYAESDIFCLQEMWRNDTPSFADVLPTLDEEMRTKVVHNLYHELQKVLPQHASLFRPHFFDFYGLCMFVKRDLRVISEGEEFVYKERGYIAKSNIPGREYADHGRNLQYVTIETAAGLRTIIHLHGLWNGGGKEDSEDRLTQSDNIIRFAETLSNPFVICGDFNLLPETESIRKFEKIGLRNLIREYSVTSTRTKHYTKASRYADYMFVSEGIAVKEFKVLPDDVSDHSPLYLEFE